MQRGAGFHGSVNQVVGCAAENWRAASSIALYIEVIP